MNRAERRAHAKVPCTWKALRSAYPNQAQDLPDEEFCVVCGARRLRPPQP